MSALVIYNPAAGSYDAKAIKTVLKAHGAVDFQRISSNLSQVIERAAERGCQTVIAVGGDGTVSAVAACVKNSPIRLAIIPAGTLNHFAKDLNIPLELDRAAHVAMHGKPKKVDTASVNGQTFINNSSIGLYPSVIRERNKQKDSLGKWPAALLALIKILPRIKKYAAIIRVHNKNHPRKTPFIFVGNNSYQLNAVGFGNRTRLDASELCVYAVNTSKIRRVVRIFLRALTGRAERARDFDAFRAPTVEIAFSKAELSVAYDGEVTKLKTPLSYKIEPKSLTVIIPR